MTFAAASWTALDIVNKVRNITGTPISNTNQSALSNQQIMNYVNTYVQYMMPFELKEQINSQPFNFQTVPYQSTYIFSGLTQTAQPVCYVDGFPQIFYMSRDMFYQDWPIQYASDNVASGNGATATFTTNTQYFPIIADGVPGGIGTFAITDGLQVVYDVINNPWNGSGILYQQVNAYPLPPTAVGTINYVTGAYTVTFNAPPALGSVIYNKYEGYQPARPQGVLLDSTANSLINPLPPAISPSPAPYPMTTDTITLTFMPVPAQVHQVSLQGFIVQNQLLSTGAYPLQTEWGQLIAYGAAAEIYADRGDMVAYNILWNPQGIIKRYENIALGRFVAQLEDAQSVPRF